MTSTTRRRTKAVRIGSVAIGGKNPIAVQSMATIKTSSVKALIKQIKALERSGCDIVRVSVLDMNDALALKKIRPHITIPLCADIHFDYNLALCALTSGADKIRINPGNIGEREKIKKIVSLAKKKNIPIRIGANSGSIDPRIHSGKTLGQRLASSALVTLEFIESLKYKNIVLSAKANSVPDTVEAYRIMAGACAYPLHLGVTASGAGEYAVIKSSVGIGTLLSEGIGDTIRVSLTDDPVREISVAAQILQSVGLRARDWEVIACPTCGRTEIDVIGLARAVEEKLRSKRIVLPKRPYRIAVMGCVVNGPGESKEADIGISGGRGFGFIFKKGTLIKKVEEKKLLHELIRQIKE
jgi:(E)-4-hydroxy-3-methylbut-2-enyl-diphosphate synthase